MPYPPNYDLALEGKAQAIRQAHREMYARQLLIHFDDQRADQHLDYVGVLRRVQEVVTRELALHLDAGTRPAHEASGIPYAVVSPWKWYRRTGLIPMRPYEPGEDLTGVSVAATDIPQVGGMIACNPANQLDQWYVNPAYVAAHMVEVPAAAAADEILPPHG